jgi:hypothetical protein
MAEKVMLSITEKEQGLEVRVSEDCYGNLALIGLIEKIKLNLLSEQSDDIIESTQKYDA